MNTQPTPVIFKSQVARASTDFYRKNTPIWRIVGPVLIPLLLTTVIILAFGPVHSTQADGPTPVSGVITDTVWTVADSPYIVTGDVTVDEGYLLEIEPGVEVRFAGNFNLNIEGSLVAQGSYTDTILFTSNQTTPAPGDWGTIDLRDGSTYNILNRTVIEYGGNASRPGWFCAAGAVCVNTSSFLLDQSTIQHNATRGVVLVQSDGIISNNTFDDHPEEAIRLHNCNHAIGPCRPTILGNTFTGNASPVLQVSAQDAFIGNNQASSNQINGFVLNTPCSFRGDNTLHADNMPYVVPDEFCNVGGSAPTNVWIEPGTVVKFGAGAGLSISSSASYTVVLTATATSLQPIIFTSIKDDSVGGDTNNDGSASLPGADDWSHFLIQGDGGQATFENAVFRYGGAFGNPGPQVQADYNGHLILKDSEIYHSELGVYIFRGASAEIESSGLHDNSSTAVRIASDGEITLIDNRLEDNGLGVYIASGHPTIQDNYFEGNITAVESHCSTLYTDCAPVISPSNRFVGAGQAGILNFYANDVCIDARQNWWGSDTGPADSASTGDACGLVDNPGTGATVSNGVDYSPWEGGVARPIIARPGCGVTAQTQPTFTGRAQAGATVAFHDGLTLLGQTVTASNDQFSWTPTEPITDGLHTITAQATLGEETSLPSQELALTVDSTLPFDPAGVQILYEYHNTTYTQTLKDSSGCASVLGDLTTPVWVRPDSLMTVVVPINTDLVPGTPPTSTVFIPEPVRVSKPPLRETSAPNATLTLSNTSSRTIQSVRIASQTSTGSPVYTPYGADNNLNNLLPGETRSITVPDGHYSLLFYSGPHQIAHRVRDVWALGNQTVNIPQQTVSDIKFTNDTFNDIIEMYFAERVTDVSVPLGSYFGGSLVNEQNIPSGFLIEMPEGTYDVIMRDEESTFYFRQVNIKSRWFGDPPEIKISNMEDGVNFTINNEGQNDICEVRMSRYPDDSSATTPLRTPVDFLDYLNATVFAGGTLSFKLEPGRYYMQALDCDDKVVDERSSVEVRGTDFTWTVNQRCQTVGSVRAGGNTWPLQSQNPNREGVDSNFQDYYASGSVTAGQLIIEICENGSLRELQAGETLIDPDGYVYDARLGVGALIVGATVTCDVYDEDLQIWERWPAELYENQINPQVTPTDGYYAFFVPPGLYRVQAQALGFLPHTSHNILVVDEIVHYNVPMDSFGGIYLPFVER